MRIIKKEDLPVVAFRLGEDSELERRLTADGLLRRRGDGCYEVLTRETAGQGELAMPGDYVKLDVSGSPYPNGKEYFESHHRPRGDGRYVQIAEPLTAWRLSEPPCEELDFLLRSGRLRIDRDSVPAYFTADGWGTTLTAPRDAVIVFDGIRRGADGSITDLSFRFVAADVFEESYRILEEV